MFKYIVGTAILSVLALQLPTVQAQDSVGFQEQLTSHQSNWVEQASDTLHSSYQPTLPGTLFQWSNASAIASGPDLSEPLVTDRPDFTEASVTVGRGVSQLEFGYTFTEDNEGGHKRSLSIGEPLLRYGIFADWLELRLAIFPVNERDSTGRTTSGTEDIYLGFKIALTGQDGLLPEMAILPQMTVPTGSNAFTNESALPGVNWLYSWDLGNEWSLAGSTQINRARDDSTEYYIETAQSVAVGYGLTDELGAYFEWYGLFPSGANTARVEHYINGGFAYLLSDDIQWDIRVGTGLTTASDDLFIGTGFSIRFH